jgi:hypothetical protein
MGSTDFLFASLSYLTGMARSLDLWATLEHWNYDTSRTPEEADAWAVANDWAVVGQDLKAAIDELRAELNAA